MTTTDRKPDLEGLGEKEDFVEEKLTEDERHAAWLRRVEAMTPEEREGLKRFTASTPEENDFIYGENDNQDNRS